MAGGALEPGVLDSTHAPPGHLLAQPDAVAVTDLPLLLQVLLLRDPPGTPLLARGGHRAARRCGPAPGQGAVGPDRRAPRGQPRGPGPAERVRARGFHGLRRVD